MDELIKCPQRYWIINNECSHYIWPPSVFVIIGTILLGFSNSLATLAGVGGGSFALVILMNFFGYLPKDASFVVFSCVLAATTGNTFNFLFKAYDGKPTIQFQYAFVSIPIMFSGSFIGILLNKFFPSIITYSIIIIVFAASVKRTYKRFADEYTKQNNQILLHGQNVVNLNQESKAYPFTDERTVQILKNIGFLGLITVILSFMRGSSKIPSVIGIKSCSGTYWFLFILSFAITILYAYRNILIFKTWGTSHITSESQNEQKMYEQHTKQVLIKSLGAGILSGFGLGGGILLVPMYRNLGCKPIQAAATCAFGIFVASLLNCLQAVAIGAIQISQFLYFVLLLGSIAYIFSRIVAAQLRKRNRFSLVEGILFGMTIIGIINIPFSLYRRYADNGHNLNILFGFGHLC